MNKLPVFTVLAVLLVFGPIGCGTVPGPRTSYDGVPKHSPYDNVSATVDGALVAMIPANQIGTPMSVIQAGSYWSLQHTTWGFAIAFALDDIPLQAKIHSATIVLRKKSYQSDKPVAQLRIVNINRCLHVTKAAASSGGKSIYAYSIVDDDRRLWDRLTSDRPISWSYSHINADLLNYDVKGEKGKYLDFLLRNNSYIPAHANQADTWDRFNVLGFVVGELAGDRRLSLLVAPGTDGSYHINYCSKNEMPNSDPVLIIEYTPAKQVPNIQPSAGTATIAEKLKQLMDLLEQGLITETEYNAKRAAILDGI